MTTGREQPPPTITVPGLDVGAVADTIVDHLDRDRQLTARTIGDGHILVTRTRRPRSAVLACVLTIWIGGLGLLFLLIRRTESGSVGVRGGPRGCTVTLPTLLAAETVADLRRRLEPDAPATPATVEFDPTDDLGAATTPRRPDDLGAVTTRRRPDDLAVATTPGRADVPATPAAVEFDPTDDLGAATTPRRPDDLGATTTPRRTDDTDTATTTTTTTGAHPR